MPLFRNFHVFFEPVSFWRCQWYGDKVHGSSTENYRDNDLLPEQENTFREFLGGQNIFFKMN